MGDHRSADCLDSAESWSISIRITELCGSGRSRDPNRLLLPSASHARVRLLTRHSSKPGFGPGFDASLRLRSVPSGCDLGRISIRHVSSVILNAMTWWFAVVESKHELQNPTSADKVRLLGERLDLGPKSNVLDMGSGRAGPAVLLAATFGCHITCVEQSEEFLGAAKERIKQAGVESLVELVHLDAKEFPLEPDRYDSALCLGASFIWGGFAETVEALRPGVRAGGFVTVGEPYWHSWPLPDEFEPDEGYDFMTLAETVARFETRGVELVTVIASSQDDWDRYESLHWFAIEEWLHENPEDPDAERFRGMAEHNRDIYLRWQRDLLGWGIFVGRKR